ARAYWHRELGARVTSLDLPTDFDRAAGRQGARRAGLSQIVLDEEQTATLARVAERFGASLFMTLEAALAVCLYRITAQGAIIIGFPVAGRASAAVDRNIGCFINALPLCLSLRDEDCFASV